jgi:TPR repeat protein
MPTGAHAERRALQRVADDGISIVRIPPQRSSVGPASPDPGQHTPPSPPPAPPSPIEGAQPQSRIVKLPVKLSSLPNDSQRSWLGVTLENLEPPLARALGMPDANGALILNATGGSPASQAGIHIGDVVVSLNGTAINSMNDFRERLASNKPGSEVTLELRRIAGNSDDFPQVLRRLADSGNAQAMFRLGWMSAAGVGMARDEAEAVRWYRRGADAGNANAESALAIALLDGRGVTADPQEGLRLLRSAAAKNHVEAMFRLGHILVSGKMAEKDEVEAARLFTRAAGSGHTPSMVELGQMYSNGTGMQADPSRAALWFKQAADLGNSAGMVNLGWLYANGKGVAKNEVEAVVLYRKAAGLGNSVAMNNLAWMLQGGLGVPRKDPEEAAELMMKALDRRNEFSRQRMTQFSGGWSREFRMALQTRLTNSGFYSGRIDGEFREPTIAAINAYFNRTR